MGTEREPEEKGRGRWGWGGGERGRKGPRRSRRETGRDPRPEGRTRNPQERLPSRRCSLRGKETGGQSWPRRGAGEASNRQEPHLQHPGNKPTRWALSHSSFVSQKLRGLLPHLTPCPKCARPAMPPPGFCGVSEPRRDLCFSWGILFLVTTSASGSFAGCSQGLSALERPAPRQRLCSTHLQGS